ncbi:hypothetical protein, partial [Escherichia coli]|uniref:hypothetical protein n=1 Tax=Escherichia coli TaxID=562 RepID=UPI0030C68F4A
HPFCGAFLVFWGFKFLSIKICCLKTASYLMVCSFFYPRQRIEGAKENTREQRGHIAPKRGAAADEHTRMHRAIPSPCKAQRTDRP